MEDPSPKDQKNLSINSNLGRLQSSTELVIHSVKACCYQSFLLKHQDLLSPTLHPLTLCFSSLKHIFANLNFLFDTDLFLIVPSPLPSTMSGRSYIDQILHFRKERKAIGCPSFLWFLAPFFSQVPCLLLWVTSIRRMSLDNHPGFDSGGALWFQNLTELPHGVLGPIFPFLIASLHYINVQISFGTSSVKKADPLLAKVYKFYLDFLTLPFFGIGFLIPQGSLVYWVTNSSLSLIQQLTLKHPAVRAKLGLPDKDALATVENSEESSTAGTPSVEPPSKQRRIAVQNLSPKELLALSIKHLSREEKDLAISLLKLALDKDPEHVKAMVVMGQTLMQKGLLVEASEYLEHAISKLSLSGHLTEVEDVDHLILSSQWAGVVYMKQVKQYLSYFICQHAIIYLYLTYPPYIGTNVGLPMIL
ncbi:hypothetical protein QQP08_017682 [Theobroma cacao]|nr:hypothetical protein QQP08_017682 [Theobroma cacao]